MYDMNVMSLNSSLMNKRKLILKKLRKNEKEKRQKKVKVKSTYF